MPSMPLTDRALRPRARVSCKQPVSAPGCFLSQRIVSPCIISSVFRRLFPLHGLVRAQTARHGSSSRLIRRFPVPTLLFSCRRWCLITQQIELPWKTRYECRCGESRSQRRPRFALRRSTTASVASCHKPTMDRRPPPTCRRSSLAYRVRLNPLSAGCLRLSSESHSHFYSCNADFDRPCELAFASSAARLSSRRAALLVCRSLRSMSGPLTHDSASTYPSALKWTSLKLPLEIERVWYIVPVCPPPELLSAATP